jgi:hypothetical protein
MNRARLRLAALLILCGVLTASATSTLLAMTFALLTEGPAAVPDSLRLGASIIHFGLVLATLPAILFGGLLWLRGVRHSIVWAGMGALAGIVCLGLAWAVGPGDIDQITAHVLRRQPLPFALAFAIAGALSALLFLALMRLAIAVTRRRPARPA